MRPRFARRNSPGSSTEVAVNKDYFDENWVVIIDNVDLPNARARFDEWLSSHGVTEADLEPEAIRVDTIRTGRGDERRYLIRRDVLNSLESE
jgi:hypothetical protein